uniref:Uncharacterized protein n=1 Tax=Anguilla anguilla TaxID=7936 RepID=A0A0E9QG39_ANGAN
MANVNCVLRPVKRLFYSWREQPRKNCELTLSYPSISKE